ncbi:MAG TPA: ribosome small subunit-dependent GTPase A [Candidatus Krumholzibacteriaceae bacterium]|nr:ribosome small subunit-dependent GTPase A [Candidatus Krumholzibacteriaceae bacterium]
MNEIEEGFVIRKKGANYYVVSGDREVKCFLRGKFRISGDRDSVIPVVGDNVKFRKIEDSGSDDDVGLILSVGSRKSVFERSSRFGGGKRKILGSNLDYIFLVHSVTEPDLNLRLIDRMIVAAEHGGIEPVLCINKIDLSDDPEALKKEISPYINMGYKVLYCSVVEGRGIEEFRETLEGKRSLMAGPSGAGKTSIIARLQPELELKVGTVSSKTGKGKHTTSHFELHPLNSGGYLGDTPGIREFGINHIEKNQLQLYFRDFSDFRSSCRFSTCIHDHEPDCGVKRALEEGLISEKRYDSYIRMLKSLSENQRDF